MHHGDFTDGIEHCAVLGMPDQDWGVKIVAVLSSQVLFPEFTSMSITATDEPLRAGKSQAQQIRQELQNGCQMNLMKHEIPKRVFLVAAMPMTSSGKVAYTQLQYWLSEFDSAAPGCDVAEKIIEI